MLPPRVLPPIAAKASRVETADILIEHREPIPMPGTPSGFETGDIIRVRPEHRYALRDKDAIVLEGATLSQLTAAIRARASLASKQALHISTQGSEWLAFDTFSRRTELDLLSAEDDLPSGAYVGSLADASVASMFARIHEHKSTGRLVIISPREESWLRTEISVLRGMPAHVASSEASLETPSQLVRYKLLAADDMREVMHASVSLGRPFIELVSARLGIEATKLQARFAAERLELIAGQRSGTFAFQSITPSRARPIARSLLPFLPGMYRRGASVSMLRRLLEPYLDETFLRTTRFESWLPELKLTSVESFAVTSFGHTRTLAMALERISDQHFALAIAHLLIELGMISPSA